MKNFLCILFFSRVAITVTANSLLLNNVENYSSRGIEVNTNLLIENGHIIGIGNRIAQTADREIDGTGKSITAGLFNSSTHIGAVEVSAIGATVDSSSDNDSVTASLKIAESFNPNSTLIPHNRTHGLTHARLPPRRSSSSLRAASAASLQRLS